MTNDLNTLREALRHGIKAINHLGGAREAVPLHEALEALSRLEAAAAAEYERGRQDGMKQEHALWQMQRIGQEIEAAAVPELSYGDTMRMAVEAGLLESYDDTRFGGLITGGAELQRFASLVRSVPLTGETNAQLAVHPNHAESEQQRPVAGAVALGQPLGGGSDTGAGRPDAQGTEHVASITGFDEYGPFLEWSRHWASFPIGTRLFIRSPAAVPVGEVKPVAWEGGEGWEALAWHLCAEEHGEDACNELIWEGGPVPEPWGDRWMKYEPEAKRMIALVRQFTTPPAPIEGWRWVPVDKLRALKASIDGSYYQGEAWEIEVIEALLSAAPQPGDKALEEPAQVAPEHQAQVDQMAADAEARREKERGILLEAANHLEGDGHFMPAEDADWAAGWIRRQIGAGATP